MGLNISVKLVLEFQSKDALDLEKKKKNSAEQHKPCSIAEYKSKICFKIK